VVRVAWCGIESDGGSPASFMNEPSFSGEAKMKTRLLPFLLFCLLS